MRHDLPSKLTTEDLDIVLIDETVLLEALEWVSGCENCAEDAFTTFDCLLDAITGCDPTITEYVCGVQDHVLTVLVRSQRKPTSQSISSWITPQSRS